jgi:putative membrane protein
MPVMASARRKNGLIGGLIAIVAVGVLAGGLVLVVPARLYDWIKAFHIIAVIAWMAGMLYLPRLFVYHCVAEPGSTLSETFKIMERRLLRAIANPAMVVSWGLGLWMVYEGRWLTAHWFHAKLMLVILLSGTHLMLARWTADFAVDQNLHDQRFYRIANEIPTVLMVGIVIFAVIKPF